jgi:hypothetical protein
VRAGTTSVVEVTPGLYSAAASDRRAGMCRLRGGARPSGRRREAERKAAQEAFERVLMAKAEEIAGALIAEALENPLRHANRIRPSGKPTYGSSGARRARTSCRETPTGRSDRR